MSYTRKQNESGSNDNSQIRLIPPTSANLDIPKQPFTHKHQKSTSLISKNSGIQYQEQRSGQHSKRRSMHSSYKPQTDSSQTNKRSRHDSRGSDIRMPSQEHYASPPDTQIKIDSQREHQQTVDTRDQNTVSNEKHMNLLFGVSKALTKPIPLQKPQSRQMGCHARDMADIYSASGGSRKLVSPQVIAGPMFSNRGSHDLNEDSVSEKAPEAGYSRVVSDYANNKISASMARHNRNNARVDSRVSESEQRRLLSEQNNSEFIKMYEVERSPQHLSKNSKKEGRDRSKSFSKDMSKEQSTLDMVAKGANPETEDDDSELTQFQKVKRKLKTAWDKFLFRPKDQFKIYWDIFVIVLSIWNAIQIPMAFAFPEAFDNVPVYTYSDYIIDMCFIFDIIVNFRSCYVDGRTDELVDDPKKITKNYLKGRFWVDLVASCNFDLIFLILAPDMGDNAVTSLFGMLKLVRLLRLGRMVTYLSKSKQTKLVGQIIQLIFMLLLLLHWIACVWFILAEQTKSWIPSKDLDWDETIIFSAAETNTEFGRYQAYVILFYYACLALLGNDYVPTNTYEVMLACVLVLVGAISIGVIIGQFSQLLSDADKAKRRKSERYDMLTSKMTRLRVPEEVYSRITSYYEEQDKIQFISDRNVYKFFNKTIKVQLCAFQMEKEIVKFTANLSGKLIKITKTPVKVGQKTLINQISTISKIVFFLHDQTIIRQDALPDGFYFIIDGEVMIFQESQGDFKDYDYFEERRILENPQGEGEEAESEMTSPQKYPMSPLDTYTSSPSPFKRRTSRLVTADDNDLITDRVTFDLKPNVVSISDSQGGTLDYSAPPKSFKNTKIYPGEHTRQDEEEQKSKWERFKDFFTANEPEKVEEEQIADRTIKLKKINALEAGDIFGEISLITKLRRTASVFSTTKVTTGFIPKKKFRKLIQANHEFRYQITEYMKSYNDRMNKFLRTMIKNVPAFRTVSISSVKEIAFSLRNLTAPANECILRKGQISKKCFFVKEGCIDVMVRQKDETQPPYLMARLSKGACFNFVNSFMERPSLFDYVVSSSNNPDNNNGTTLLYVLEKDDFDNLCKRNEELQGTKTQIRSKATDDVVKYDFDRMVYANLGQLSRAQDMKKRYEKNNSLDDTKQRNQGSIVMQILQQGDKNKDNVEDSVFQVSGSASAVRNFKATMEKFKKSIETFKEENFYIRDMLIFQLVDEAFDKFSGYALNIDLAVMMYSGEHSASQRQMIKFYLKKNQGKIEREAAKRTIMTGDDHLSIAQLGYIARQEDDLHYNEEGDLVFQGDYTPEQSAMRQMQLFKIQQEKLEQLMSQVESNDNFMVNLKKNFVIGMSKKQKAISSLKVNLEKEKLQQVLDKQDYQTALPKLTANNLDKNIEEIIDSARRVGLNVDANGSQENLLLNKQASAQMGDTGNFSNDKFNITKDPVTGQKTFLVSENDDPNTQGQVSQFNQKTEEVLTAPQIDFTSKIQGQKVKHEDGNDSIASMPSVHQRISSMPSVGGNNRETNFQQWFTNPEQVERVLPENKFAKTANRNSNPLEMELQPRDSFDGARNHEYMKNNKTQFMIPGTSEVRKTAQPFVRRPKVSGGMPTSDYSSQAGSMKRMQTGEQMMRVVSDQDASEIAEKLHAIDAKGFGTKASLGTHDNGMLSPHTNRSGIPNKEGIRSDRGLGKHGSKPFIAAATMAFDKNTPRKQ